MQDIRVEELTLESAMQVSYSWSEREKHAGQHYHDEAYRAQVKVSSLCGGPINPMVIILRRDRGAFMCNLAVRALSQGRMPEFVFVAASSVMASFKEHSSLLLRQETLGIWS